MLKVAEQCLERAKSSIAKIGEFCLPKRPPYCCPLEQALKSAFAAKRPRFQSCRPTRRVGSSAGTASACLGPVRVHNTGPDECGEVVLKADSSEHVLGKQKMPVSPWHRQEQWTSGQQFQGLPEV